MAAKIFAISVNASETFKIINNEVAIYWEDKTVKIFMQHKYSLRN